MTMVLVREAVGQTLRAARTAQGRTLRDVARDARVSLGYLSEVERGQKEASSEILSSVAEALDVPISVIMREVSDRMAIHEGVKFNASFAPAAAYGDGSFIPDTVPDLFMADFDGELLGSH